MGNHLKRLNLKHVDQELGSLFGAAQSAICQFCGRVIEDIRGHVCSDDEESWRRELMGDQQRYGRVMTYVVE